MNEEVDYRCQCRQCNGTQFYILTATPKPGETTAPLVAVQCCRCGWEREL